MPREDGQFKPGNAGRPKGARNKLKESFVSAYQRHFREHGVVALDRLLDESPANYLALGTKLFPPEVMAKELANGAGGRVAITMNFAPTKTGAGDDAKLIEGTPHESDAGLPLDGKRGNGAEPPSDA